MKKRKRILAGLLMVAMILSGIVTPDHYSSAAKKLTMQKKLTLKVGATKKLKVRGKKKSQKVTWKSSKKRVASVSKKGKVKALKAGTTTITAKVKGKKLKCKVTVKKKSKGSSSSPSSPSSPDMPTSDPSYDDDASSGDSGTPTATPAPISPGPDSSSEGEVTKSQWVAKVMKATGYDVQEELFDYDEKGAIQYTYKDISLKPPPDMGLHRKPVQGFLRMTARRESS